MNFHEISVMGGLGTRNNQSRSWSRNFFFVDYRVWYIASLLLFIRCWQWL